MLPGTPTTSADESDQGLPPRTPVVTTRRTKALSSKLCQTLTPPRKTITENVHMPTSTAGLPPPTTVDTTRRTKALSSKLCQSLTPPRKTINEHVDMPTSTTVESSKGSQCADEQAQNGVPQPIDHEEQKIPPPVQHTTVSGIPSQIDSLAPYQPVHIPEFDPMRKNTKMPNWMRYDPCSQDGKYRCIVCDVGVAGTSEPKYAEEHERGKKHQNKLYNMSYRVLQTVQNLTTLVRQRFDLQLRLFTSDNILMMPDDLRSIVLTKDDIVSVGFVIEDGHLHCLCLVTKNFCVNIDRTVLEQANKIRSMVEFKEVFEGDCITGGVQMWELVLVLYHQYGIRCRALVDVDDGSGNGVGEDLILDNFKLHTQMALKAAGCYDLIDGSEKKLRNFDLTPDRVLQHICKFNLQLYGMYREVRGTNLDVTWSDASVNDDGMVVKLKCDDYNSRIRKNSVVQLYTGTRVITGRCLEWDGGRLVEIHLESSLDVGAIQRITVNRREEDHLMRVLLRNYVNSLGSKSYIGNRFQNHMYGFKTLGMKKEYEEEYKKSVSPSVRLNKLQNIAMLRSLYPISMIHGPPGTGKTRVLSEIVVNAVGKGEGVICLGWTNVSVRRLCETLRQVLSPDVLGILTSREFKCWHKSDYEHLKDVEVKNCCHQVVCMTVSNYLLQTMDATTCNMWCASKHNPTLLTQRALMLGDEASQLWEMIAVLLISRTSGYKRIVWGGDDIQLAPYLHKDTVDAPSVMSWIRRLSGVFQIPITQLRIQYRMMPSVGKVVSEIFYENNLQHHKKSDGKNHLFFHSLEGKMDKMGNSPFCKQDSIRCIEILKRYRGSNFDCRVLTFYEAQRSHLKSIDEKVNVCCIDSFQGQEADVIILLLSTRKRNISPFMLNRGRLCVGTSRAKKDFHIVGNWDTMFKNDTWRKLILRCKRVY